MAIGAFVNCEVKKSAKVNAPSFNGASDLYQEL